jgi:hypothetical protein
MRSRAAAAAKSQAISAMGGSLASSSWSSHRATQPAARERDRLRRRSGRERRATRPAAPQRLEEEDAVLSLTLVRDAGESCVARRDASTIEEMWSWSAQQTHARKKHPRKTPRRAWTAQGVRCLGNKGCRNSRQVKCRPIDVSPLKCRGIGEGAH